MMYIMDGEFEFTLFGETNLYTAGDIVSIPSNEPHSGKALTPCRLMDVFSPVREEYR
jgi:quercetin dioxygenase-like cupin family protein